MNRPKVAAGVLAALLSAGLMPAAAAPPAGAPTETNSDFTHFEAGQGSRGSAVFAAHCTACHANGVGHAPPVTILGLMPPGAIVNTLTNGAMRIQGQGLTDAERIAVAEFLSGKPLGKPEEDRAPRCVGRAAAFDFAEPPVFPGWGLTDGNTRAIPAKVGGLTASNIGHLKLKWAFAFPDALRARSHPILAGGAIFIGSHLGAVYALDRRTGCVRWRFQAAGETRTGLVVSGWRAGDRTARPLVYFGDLTGNVYALNAINGRMAWKVRADSHPSTTLTAAPTLYGKLLYVPVSSLEEAIIDPGYQCCTFRGSVLALNARTGAPVWRTFMTPSPQDQGLNPKGEKKFGPSGAPIWNTPAIDVKRRQLTVGTGDNYSSPATTTSDAIIALDLASGRVNWVYQTRKHDAWNVACGAPDTTLCPTEKGPDYDLGAATIVATDRGGHDHVLAGSKSGDVYAVDAAKGKLQWDVKVGRGGVLAGIYFGMAVSADRVFVPVSDAADGRTYSEPARPGLYALDLKTGRYLWKAPDTGLSCVGRAHCVPGIASAISVTGDLVIAPGSDGWLRIRDVRTGKELWSYDTTQPVTAVGGAMAKGGAMAGGVGPIAYHGMLIMPSGYGFAGKIPGNALLVFDTR